MDMSVGPGTFPVIAKLTVENGAMDVSNYKEAVIFLHSNGNVCVASRVGFQPEEIIRELQEHEIKALDIKDCEGGR